MLYFYLKVCSQIKIAGINLQISSVKVRLGHNIYYFIIKYSLSTIAYCC